jgi:hypothetical protein
VSVCTLASGFCITVYAVACLIIGDSLIQYKYTPGIERLFATMYLTLFYIHLLITTTQWAVFILLVLLCILSAALCLTQLLLRYDTRSESLASASPLLRAKIDSLDQLLTPTGLGGDPNSSTPLPPTNGSMAAEEIPLVVLRRPRSVLVSPALL